MREGRAEIITAEQKVALQAELSELEGPRRAAIVEAIAVARSYGDLSENFEYHAAKNEQGLNEARIRRLRERLLLAEVVEHAGDTVGPGSIVGLESEHGAETVTISSVGGVSPDSPLGKALLGAVVGDVRDVVGPRGVWAVTVTSITH